MKNFNKLIKGEQKVVLFISLCFCVSSSILIPFWSSEIQYLDNLSNYRKNGVDMNVNFSTKIGTPWSTLNNPKLNLVNQKYASKFNISTNIFYFADIIINSNNMSHIVRFISIPCPLLELNEIFQGLFESKKNTSSFPENGDFFIFQKENSSLLNPLFSKNGTKISIKGVNIYNESVIIEGIGENYFNGSLYDEYQTLFSSKCFYSEIFNEIEPIQDYIFLTQEKMYELFKNYSLPVYGTLLLNFGIKNFTLLHLRYINQLYSLPIEEIIYDHSFERLDINYNEGIICYLKGNTGYMVNLYLKLIIILGLCVILILIISQDVLKRYFDKQDLLFFRLKKYGVNIVSFSSKVEKDFILKFLLKILIPIIIFTIVFSIWLSFTKINIISLFFQGFVFFGLRLLIYFLFLITSIILIFHNEYQKHSVATMFSINKTDNIYSKIPIIKELINNIKMRWIFFAFTGIILCIITYLLYSPISLIRPSNIKSIFEIILIDLVPIIFIIIFSIGFSTIFSSKTKRIINDLGITLTSFGIFKDRYKKGLVLLWKKRNQQGNLPKSILLISIILFSFLGMNYIQEKNYFNEKQIYIKNDIRVDIQFKDNKFAVSDYFNISKMPDHQILRGIICQ
ncbi:hypothetical protein [Candidatus Harpocratesius sp.]